MREVRNNLYKKDLHRTLHISTVNTNHLFFPKRLLRFIIATLGLTFIALLYVHQQIRLIELGYEVHKNEKILSRLLDRHRRLIYNVAKLQSPQVLESRLSEAGEEFTIPMKWQIVRASSKEEKIQSEVYLAKSEQKRKGLILFRFRASTAEARPVK